MLTATFFIVLFVCFFGVLGWGAVLGSPKPLKKHGKVSNKRNISFFLRSEDLGRSSEAGRRNTSQPASPRVEATGWGEPIAGNEREATCVVSCYDLGSIAPLGRRGKIVSATLFHPGLRVWTTRVAALIVGAWGGTPCRACSKPYGPSPQGATSVESASRLVGVFQAMA